MTAGSGPVRSIERTDKPDRTKAGGKAFASLPSLPCKPSLSPKSDNGLIGQTGQSGRDAGKVLLRVIQDTREQAPFTFSGLPVDVAVGALEAGDYSVAGFERSVAVERKELQDLIGCLSGERARFERELARLRGYDAAAVVIEAPALALRSGRYLGRLDAGAAWQSVLAFTQRFRVPFIFCADRADAEAVTYDLLRHFARDRWRELRALAPAMLRRDKNSGQQVAERTP